MDAELAGAGLKPMKRLQLMQERRDIDAAIEAARAEPAMTRVKARFIEPAAA